MNKKIKNFNNGIATPDHPDVVVLRRSMKRRNVLLLASAAMFRPISAPSAMPAKFTTVEIARGLHVRHGVHAEATVENQDGIANIGFIVGDRSVAVIDPGGSRADGEHLRARIRAVTDRPISHVILSHLHPDHVFGAPAFAADHPVFVAHHKMLAMLDIRGDFYRSGLIEQLGPGAAGDYVRPTLSVEDPISIDLGARVLHVRAHKTAHTDNDLSIFDTATATIWLADLLFVDRVPALDGSLMGWLAETQNLRASPARLAVPGHGPVSVAWPQALEAQERYLNVLLNGVREIIASGGNIERAVAKVGKEERDHWLLFNDYNAHNVSAAFKELQWDE